MLTMLVLASLAILATVSAYAAFRFADKRFRAQEMNVIEKHEVFFKAVISALFAVCCLMFAIFYGVCWLTMEDAIGLRQAAAFSLVLAVPFAGLSVMACLAETFALDEQDS